ncbi:MAG: PAC2 family protein, partial [Solirubrobacteraceae bacterium]
KLEGLVGVVVDAGSLEEAAAEYEQQVNAAVAHDPDIQAFVEKLEASASDQVPDTLDDLPSGDSIERELQRFLRQRGQDPPK